MNYDDIINLPHFHAKNRPFMSRQARAAQFMPFKSLVGYHEQIDKEENEFRDQTWQTMVYDDVQDDYDEID